MCDPRARARALSLKCSSARDKRLAPSRACARRWTTPRGPRNIPSVLFTVGAQVLPTRAQTPARSRGALPRKSPLDFETVDEATSRGVTTTGVLVSYGPRDLTTLRLRGVPDARVLRVRSFVRSHNALASPNRPRVRVSRERNSRETRYTPRSDFIRRGGVGEERAHSSFRRSKLSAKRLRYRRAARLTVCVGGDILLSTRISVVSARFGRWRVF